MKKILSIIPLLIVILLATFLRFYDLAHNPPGLYMDEVSIGYNAHTILTKGVDEHGEKYPLMFRAFGEYKMPIYIYVTAGSEFIFGKNEFAIRFPAAFVGVLTVILLYLFVKTLVRYNSPFADLFKKYLPLLSAFLLAISPWHVQFSRGGFEATIALFFYLCALYFIIRLLEKRLLLFVLLSSFCFALTTYTYFAYRVITPLTIFILLFFNWRIRIIPLKQIGIFVGSILFYSLPLIYYSSSGFARFSQTSAFNEYPIKHFWETLYVYPMVYLKNYLSYFSLSFLFANGDGIGRHQMPWFGVLPKWESIFLVIGAIYVLKKKKSIITYLLVGLLLVAPTAAAFAVPSPQSLRSLLMVVPITIIVGIGILVIVTNKLKLFRNIGIAILLVGCLESVFFIHHYISHYPRVNQLDWGGGYKEVVQAAAQEDNTVFVMDESLPYASVYFKFYNDSLPLIRSDQVSSMIINNKRLIRVAHNRKSPKQENFIKHIMLPNNIDNEPFAQFWEINTCYCY